MDGLHPLSSLYHSYPRSKFKREGRRERRERRERESCNQLTLTSTWFRTCWSLMAPREGRLALPPTSYTLWGCGYQSRGRNTHKKKDSTHQTLNLNQHSLIHNFIRIENCQIIALLFLINVCSDWSQHVQQYVTCHKFLIQGACVHHINNNKSALAIYMRYEILPYIES